VSRRALHYAAVALAAILWGTWPLILRFVDRPRPVPPALTSAVVMGVVTIVSLLMVTRDRVRAPKGTRGWAGIALLGVADAMNILLFFNAYRRTSVAIAVLTHYLTPIFVALAAPLLLKERFGARTAFAVGVAFAGLVLLLNPWKAEREPGDWIGAALGAGSAVFYASNVIVNKRIAAVFSASELMGYHALLSTFILAAFVPGDAWRAVDARAITLLAIGALGPGAAAGLLFVWGLRGLPASHVSILALLEPLVAVLIGAALLGEHLGLLAAVGGALILGGAAVVVTQPSPAAASKMA
jgi:drug/metabolite transporter (DMT)-like permease